MRRRATLKRVGFKPKRPATFQRTTFKPKRRAAPATLPEDKRRQVQGWIDADRARDARETAEVEGCEYSSVFLRELFDAAGCQLCDRWHPVMHPHHTVTRNNLGKAEDLVALCPKCHRKGHDGGWEALEAFYGKDLRQIAKANAEEGLRLQFLPVEMCEECAARKRWGRAWHSTGALVDLVEEGKPTQRVCRRCAPSGPP